jgi:hypothetical protein
MIWKTSEKNETEIQNTMEGYSSRIDKQKTESQNLKMKWKLKEILKRNYSNK